MPTPPPDASPLPRGRYGLLFAAQAAVWLALYYGINAATAGRSVATPLLDFERHIPFVPAAYPIYAAVYVQVLLPLFLARTRRDYWTIQLAFAVASLVGFATFLAAPMAYPRPSLEVTDAFTWLLSLEYATDGPRCTLPSLHVAFAWILYLSLGGRSHRWRMGLGVSAAAISVSTLLVKQHFLVDVVVGAALAVASWWAARVAVAAWGRQGETR